MENKNKLNDEELDSVNGGGFFDFIINLFKKDNKPGIVETNNNDNNKPNNDFNNKNML